MPSSVIVPAGIEDVEAAALSGMRSAEAAAPEGGAAATIWCMAAACHGLGGDLGYEGGREVSSCWCVLEGTVGFYVWAAAPDELV